MSLVDHFSQLEGVRARLWNLKRESKTTADESNNTLSRSENSEIPLSESDISQSKTSNASSTFNTNDQERSTCLMIPSSQLHVDLTEKDLKFIVPLAKLVVRLGALSPDKMTDLKNIYDAGSPQLSEAILSKYSSAAGEYLIKKYVCQEQLFGFKKEDCPDITSVDCIKEVKNKLKISKGTTIRIATIKKVTPKSKEEEAERKRKSLVRKQQSVVDCMSSNMNTCQALVKPDCSKGALQKSTGIKKALIKALWYTFDGLQLQETEAKLTDLGIICSDVNDVRNENIKIAVFEFAGVKFHTPAASGNNYLNFVSTSVIGKTLRLFPRVEHMVICEEKYLLTPDDLKAETRAKRQKSTSISIAQLKQQEEIVSEDRLSKAAVRSTAEGKSTISTYLAKNISKLPLFKDLTIDIDSEAYLGTCNCGGACQCASFGTPIRCTFHKDNGYDKQEYLFDVKQRKGEAEMSQVDWYQNVKDMLKEGQSVVSIVTSGDIDSIVIHIFALSHYWPRKEDGTFKNSVYILLQKAKPDLYNITEIILRLEKRFGMYSKNLALSLAIGGNDFIPKYHSISHEKWITAILENPIFLESIATYDIDVNSNIIVNGSVNTNVYLDIVKRLYCPNNINPATVSLNEVQQLTIKRPGKEMRNPKSWMPPKSALEKMAKLVECQLQYLTTVWKHDADLPNFLEKGCLLKSGDGKITYNFGENIKVDNPDDVVTMTDDAKKSLLKNARKRPRSNHGTPTKVRKPKCRPKISTPRLVYYLLIFCVLNGLISGQLTL